MWYWDFRESGGCVFLSQSYSSESVPEYHPSLDWAEILICSPVRSAGNLEFLSVLLCEGSTSQVSGLVGWLAPPQWLDHPETVQTTRLGLCCYLLCLNTYFFSSLIMLSTILCTMCTVKNKRGHTDGVYEWIYVYVKRRFIMLCFFGKTQNVNSVLIGIHLTQISFCDLGGRSEFCTCTKLVE